MAGGAASTTELERARAAGASPGELVRLLDELIAAEDQARGQRSEWRLERERLLAEMARVRATEFLAGFEAGESSAQVADALREAIGEIRALERGRAAEPARDAALIRRLERQLTWVEVRPLVEEIERSLLRARAAGPAEAEAWFSRARDRQAELNERFPQAAQASEARLRRIEDELAAARRGEREGALARLLDAAEAESRAGREVERERLLAEAGRLRTELSAGLPPTEIAQRRQAFQQRAQSIRALPRLLALARLDEEVAAALRAGDAATAAERLELAVSIIASVSEDFPQGVEIEAGLRERLAYLMPRRSRLGDLQKEFLDTLVPVPGRPGLRMMRVEMPQGLHERVGNQNPSRVTGARRPVESVSWWDAAAVAERLSWIMGAEVRLPTRAEWLSALGDGEQSGWLAENAEGVVRETGLWPASRAGFHDLVGNVAEWLQPEAGSPAPTAGVAGGSVADEVAAVVSEPVRQFNAQRRDRLIGYRLVMVGP